MSANINRRSTEAPHQAEVDTVRAAKDGASKRWALSALSGDGSNSLRDKSWSSFEKYSVGQPLLIDYMFLVMLEHVWRDVCCGSQDPQL